MGVDITFFGSGTYFGSDTLFGYRYDDDRFDTDSLDDVESIILEMGDVYVITRETTTEDSLGHTTAITTSEFNIWGLLQDISKKDRKVHAMGLAVPGNIVGYFLPSYGSGTINEIKEGDILTDKQSSEWRVVKIVAERTISDTEIFIKIVLRNINLEGS